MAITDFGVNDNSTVKLWSKMLTREAFAQTYIQRFMGTGSNTLLVMKDDLSSKNGDRIRCSLRLLMDADGVTEDEVLEGNEETMRFSTEDLIINELAHASRWHRTIADQRVTYDLREESMSALSTWFAEKYDESFFNQIASNTAATTKAAGNNAAIAATSTSGNTRMIIGPLDYDGTTEGSLSKSSSNFFQLPILNEAVRIAKTASPLIRPIRIDGVDRYVAFIAPGQVFDMQTDIEASTTRIKWADIHTAAMQGGQISSNPIFTGAIGMYNNVVMHESTRLPVAPSNANARRAVFCGAQAAFMAFGKSTPGLSSLDWHEESFDHGRQHSVKAGALYGVVKSQVLNREAVTVDYGTILMTTMETGT